MPKPPSPKYSVLERIHKMAQDGVVKAGELASNTATTITGHFKALDEKLEVTNTVAAAGKQVADMAGRIDADYGITAKATKVVDAASGLAMETGTTLKRKADDSGITRVVTEGILKPAQRMGEAISGDESVRRVLQASEQAYGDARQHVLRVIAPTIRTYDCDRLLSKTRSELNYIAACILQISPVESSRVGRQFGRAVTAKISGLTGTGALLGIVAAFGHAGTDTAISGLSGAAATSATMAWMGSLVGGGVAAGTVLTGGLAFVAGLGAYKALASDHREFETLSELEQRIVKSCWMLAAVAEAYRERPHEFTAEVAAGLLENGLKPLYKDIKEHLEVLCGPLDGKHAILMRQHVLQDFNAAVTQQFHSYLQWAFSEEGRDWNRILAGAAAAAPDLLPASGSDADIQRILREGNAEAVIGGAFAELLRGAPVDDSLESRLVLSALRRSSISLHDASDEQLGDYLRDLSPAGLRGQAANVKGIYHELYYVDRYNATHLDGTAARLHEATNHPGSDVQIYDLKTNEVYQELQLKAVETAEPIHAHMARYPNTSVAATSEAAAKYHGEGDVDPSGFSNQKLTDDTRERIDDLRDDTPTGHAIDTATIALGIATTAELLQMLRGEREFPAAIMNTATKVATAAGATAFTAFLFS